MKAIVLLALLAITISHPVNKRFVDYLRKNVKWTVADPSKNKFRDWTKEEIKALMNIKPRDTHKYTPKPFKPRFAEYDFREFYPECVMRVKDEGNCGASWSFSSVTSFENRLCMYTDFRGYLSAQDPISCCKENDGCNGGTMDVTFDYLKTTGVVDDACFPFTAAEGDVEACPTECKNGQPWKKYIADDTNFMFMIDDIINDLVNYGPSATTMEVYEDFLSYMGGTYEYFGGDYLGMIAVTLIGYGFDDFDPERAYLICQNDWGEEWGEFGYFQIYLDQCRVAKEAYAVWPKF